MKVFLILLILRGKKFEPHEDLVDEVYANYTASLGSNQGAYGQVENDKTMEVSNNVDYLEEQDHSYCQTWDAGIRSGICMSETLSDHGIAENIQIVNNKQHVSVDICHKWAKSYVKSLSSKEKYKVDPIHSFISGYGVTGKLHVVKIV